MSTIITQLQPDYLESAARTFAQGKAEDIGGALAELIFMHLPVTVYHFRDEAEERAQELLRGLLKLALVEFTRAYSRELQWAYDQNKKILEAALAATQNTTIIRRAGTSELAGSLQIRPYCPVCSHPHQEADHCGVSMGGAGTCDCKEEVRT